MKNAIARKNAICASRKSDASATYRLSTTITTAIARDDEEAPEGRVHA